MLMVVEGKVEVQKRDRWNTPQTLAVVEGGRTLGEMSMIDGEARFATCVAAQPTLIAVLHRESLARIIVEQPLRSEERRVGKEGRCGWCAGEVERSGEAV